MKIGIFYILALVLTVGMSGSASAAEADGAGRKRAGPAGAQGVAGLLLQHADELALTADQKAKLEEMAKGPMGILTEDQKKKAIEIVKTSRPNPAGGAPDAEGKRAKKKDAPEGEKKPVETKAEAK